jgi:HEPN domain-containing protein
VEDGEALAEIAERLFLRILLFLFLQWPDCGILKEQDQLGEPFMAKDPEEWFRQADYDLETAEDLFNGGRYFYAVFMSHLSIEKALKGIYQAKLKEIPPRVHHLVYLLNKIGMKPPEIQAKFLIKLNEASVATRYPEALEILKKDYTQSVVKDILLKSKEVLEWIKNQR